MADSYAELKALRKEMGYTIKEMADNMALKKATYQGYESGRRAMPAGFINRVREWQQIDLDFFAGANDRIDQRWINDGFPPVIKCKITLDEMEADL